MRGTPPESTLPTAGARQAVLREALDAIRQVPDDWRRSRALRGLARHLSYGMLSEALALARDLTEAGARSRALADLARYLPVEEREQILQAAIAAVRQLPSEADRVGVLNLVARQSSGDARLAIGREALSAIQQSFNNAWSLAGSTLGDELVNLPSELTEAALELTRCLPIAWERAQTLGILAGRLPSEAREIVFQEASHIAQGLADPAQRALVIAGLAHHSPEPLRSRLVKESLDSIQQCEDDLSRARVAGLLLPLLPEKRKNRILALTRSINDRVIRMHALAWLAPNLPDDQGKLLVEEACSILESQSDDWVRADGLALLSPLLPVERLPDALSIAHALDDAWARAEALGVLSERMNESGKVHTLAAALAAARSLDAPWPRARALTGVVARL